MKVLRLFEEYDFSFDLVERSRIADHSFLGFPLWSNGLFGGVACRGGAGGCWEGCDYNTHMLGDWPFGEVYVSIFLALQRV